MCWCRAVGAEGAEEEGADQGGGDEGSALVLKFKQEHRKLRKNWDLPERFPDARVIKAYREVGGSLNLLYSVDQDPKDTGFGDRIH